MILYISGRTDIVAFYTPWLLNRIREGFVDVRNPFYPKMVSRIFFRDVDLFVFCTKNPLPILSYLKEIRLPIVFQVTLTPYQNDIEPNVLNKKKIIEGIKKLSEIIGKENLFVRYDPILLNSKYTIEYHIKAFEKLCNTLKGFVNHIIISFVDTYKNVLNNQAEMQLQEIKDEDVEKIALNFYRIGKEHGMLIQSCNEGDLEKYGIKNEPCISKNYAYQLTGKKFPKWSARNCGCVSLVDIGVYNTCNHLCKYCYANFEEKKVKENRLKHDRNSSLLFGHLKEDDEIKIRKK